METETAPPPKTSSRSRPNVRYALRVGLSQVLLMVCGMIFIRRDVYLQGNVSSIFQHWQEAWVCAAMGVDGIIRGAYGLGPVTSPFRKKILRWGLPIGLFLYSACGALCIKLHVGYLDYEWARNAGVAILSVSLLVNLLSALNRPCFVFGDGRDNAVEQSDSPGDESHEANVTEEKLEVRSVWRYVRYPDRFAIMIMLAGLALSMGTWVPLLALPGLFVAFKWEIGDLESYRLTRYKDQYLEYRKTSKALIPFIY